MAKQTIKQRKALRSAAAKKGWETRRARIALEAVFARHAKPSLFQRIREWFA